MPSHDTLSPPAGPTRRLGRRLLRLPAVILAVVLIGCAAVTGFAVAQSKPAAVGTGVVVIDTSTAAGDAAGTGMVLTSTGEILTNNHVIEGARTVRIVVPKTGKRYTAKVVGYDTTHDVAVLQASGASNLKTVTIGDSSTVKTGQAVTAVGNANGTGSLTTASGTITGVGRSITVSEETGATARLTALLETDAGLQAGDSGGPLFNAKGEVIGMDTAASVGYGPRQIASSDGYAIPIDRAISIAHRIEDGTSSSTVHIGATAYMGIEATQADGGVGVAAVESGSAADDAGLAAGDVITGLGGHSVATPTQLTALLLRQKPGARVSVSYTDRLGRSQTATITLGSGPPQ